MIVIKTMRNKFLIFSFLLLYVCCKEATYSPDGLTKLTEEQLIERAKNKDFPSLKTIVYKNEKGEVISTDSVQKIPNMEEWTADWYADKEGVVKEFVLRKATEKDKKLQLKVQEAFNAQPTK